jgi:DNA topoisomerase VI subunit B
VPNGMSSYHDGDSGDGDGVCTANKNEYSIGEGDLICQIVKELVDNAVDACRSPIISENNNLQNESGRGNQKKRIRVDIKPFTTSGGFVGVSTAAFPSNEQNRDSVLQVTVTDTGCGMENIQNCVNAFQSSKDGDEIIRNYNNITFNNNSSGRYGIGLTLCLLHAQRCVPNSRACISSATPKSKFRTRAFFEVDKQEDVVKCVQEEVINFSASQQESGTCVSLLVPVSNWIVRTF